jgi:hypothetical protein
MTGQDINISRGMVQAFRAGLDTWAGHMDTGKVDAEKARPE